MQKDGNYDLGVVVEGCTRFGIIQDLFITKAKQYIDEYKAPEHDHDAQGWQVSSGVGMQWVPIPFPSWSPALQIGGFPFSFPISACTWNAQGLFASKEVDQRIKVGRAWSLARHHDVLAAQDTHDDGLKHQHLTFLLRHSHE
eukprot:5713589-Heterocapsa_arctica.AAC.1